MALFLKLFHGRKDPDQDMDDWGFEGPHLGPMKYVHTTYAHDIKFAMEVEAYKKAFPEDAERAERESYYHNGHRWVDGHLMMHNDMIHLGDSYYGDWSAYDTEVC